MKRGGLNPNLKLKLSLPPPDEVSIAKFLTQSGTFMDGDLLVNRDGVRIVSQDSTEAPAPIKPTDNQLSLADIDTIKVIGKGSSGTVQLVQHKWTGQFFALKVIQMTIEESTRKAIAKELKINQSSQCPYVVMCYQSFYVNGVISIILEYMDGGSLADLLRKVKSIPEPYLAGICKQVLKGLMYLHQEKHIIHRDLKPSNLLINHRGEVKITDFGVSAIIANTYAQANTFVGTYNYMSPERISGGKYSYKSDIWSLGLLLLECATGKFPYSPPDEGDDWTNVYELMEAVVDKPQPCAPPDQFSSQFCSFISSCASMFPLDATCQLLIGERKISKMTSLKSQTNQNLTRGIQGTVYFCQGQGTMRNFEKHRGVVGHLDQDTKFSVQKDPNNRLAAHELMEHPFLKMYDNRQIDLPSYFKDAGSPLATF